MAASDSDAERRHLPGTFKDPQLSGSVTSRPKRRFSIEWEVPVDAKRNEQVEAVLWQMASEYDLTPACEASRHRGNLVPLTGGGLQIPTGRIEQNEPYRLEFRRVDVLSQTSRFDETFPDAQTLTANEAHTRIDLRLADDPLPEPQLRWLFSHSVSWKTAAPIYLSPSLSPPPTITKHFALFEIRD